mgnify:CR=1 FL=1
MSVEEEERSEFIGDIRPLTFMEDSDDEDYVFYADHSSESFEMKTESFALRLRQDPYVFFIPHSHSHLFNKLEIHTHIYVCIYNLTQAIMHNYVTLEPQGVTKSSRQERRVK